MSVQPIYTRSLLLYLVSSFLQAGFYWALTAAIARLFSSSELGGYSYLMAVLTPLTVLGGLQARSFILTGKNDRREAHLKWLRFSFPTSLFILGYIFISWVEPEFSRYFLFLALMKWGEMWSELAQSHWQLHHGLKWVNTSLLYRYLGLLLILLYFFISKTDLLHLFMGLAGYSLVIGALDFTLSGLYKLPFLMKDSWVTFLTTLSLSLSSLLAALIVNLPRYQLKEYLGLEEVGSFTLLFYYYVIPSMILNYACQGLLKEFKSLILKDKFFSSFLISIAGISLLFAVFLFFCGPGLNQVLYKKELPWSFAIVTMISLAFFLGSISSVFHYSLMAKNIYHIQLRTNIFSSLTTLLLGFLMIPKWGVTGAFISFIAGLLVQSLVYAVTFNRIKL